MYMSMIHLGGKPEEAREAFGTAGSLDTKQQCFPIKNGDCEMKHQGVILENLSSDHILVEDSTGQTWRLVCTESWRTGKHKCNFVGAGVTFTFSDNAVTDLKIDVPDFDPDAKEESTIIYVDRATANTSTSFGYLRRGCGCSLVFRASDILTLGRIAVGVDCRNQVALSGGRCVATNIEIYKQ
jgi:hypothetical protein